MTRTSAPPADTVCGSVLDVAPGRRITALDPATRALHRMILRAFAATGGPPAVPAVAAAAAELGLDPRKSLAGLVDRDIIGMGARRGDIVYAYPFSARPTAHRVHLVDGAQPYAMCAVDALGMPAMLNSDALITSVDPYSGESITITVTDKGRTARWQPGGCVAFIGTAGDCCAGTAAQVCCDYLNVFTSAEHAHAWAAGHPHVRGCVVDRDRALRLGIDVFGDLLG
ncbi:alkylmercury lyase family protein [Lentzea flaviverrucosa]|uniref:alkylmercury lyase family protein n=1 Tax=Lentzea flaviverrucosa TaxID=200379 RepID=UPI000B7D7ADF|nr:alkylmercury lyase family protein [Lentzea flaviverrucosa]